MLNFREELNQVTKQKEDEKKYTRYTHGILQSLLKYLEELPDDTYLAIKEVKFQVEYAHENNEKFIVKYSTDVVKDVYLFEVYLHPYSTVKEKLKVLEGLKKKISDEGFEYFQTERVLIIKLKPNT